MMMGAQLPLLWADVGFKIRMGGLKTNLIRGICATCSPDPWPLLSLSASPS